MLPINSLHLYLERTLLTGSAWTVKALLLLLLGSVFFNVGFDLKHFVYLKNFFALVNGHPDPKLCCYFWTDVEYQTTDWFMQKLQIWDTVHQANMRLRLFLPVLWSFFHSILAIYLLQVALGIAQMYMILRLVYRHTQDRLQAFYFTAGFSGLYAGAAYYLDVYAYGDAFGYAFLIAALFFRRPFFIASAIFLAAWVDERTLFNASYIVLYHWLALYRPDREQPILFRVKKPTPQALAVIAGGVVYMAVRVYLSKHYHIAMSIGGPSLFFHVREAIRSFGIRLYSGFESFWLLIVSMIGTLIYYKKYILLAMILPLLAVTTFTMLMAGDFTRTISYGFPIIFLSFSICRQVYENDHMRLLLLSISLLATLFFPLIY
ncbi:hypothetical protein [Spirosoma oryzicola]|uniref:hypothetical protein n=1 Tax=Spirosoma oryzicola TaxID=2898794 RepID=UPI001E30B521|nr:hypothetical protein [Spirosoma oryzicola]UHG90680.1 hypothetical protein LQ777_20850 [Spirosoma oryzicola]